MARFTSCKGAAAETVQVMSRKNRYKEAFQEQGNLAGLGVAAAVSAALLNPLPLVAGLVAEAAYLLTVPDSKWYQKRLTKRQEQAVLARRKQLMDATLPTLEPEVQNRFARLVRVREQLGEKATPDQNWMQDVLRKLDYLMEKFLVFAAKDLEFRRYLAGVWQNQCGEERLVAPTPIGGSTPPAPQLRRASQMVQEVQKSYAGEISELRRTQEADADLNARSILEKRVEVLEQRAEGIGKIGRILTNLQHQMGLLEDTFGLINDQIHARSPEQVLSDIESVVYQTDSMTKLLEDLAPFQDSEAD